MIEGFGLVQASDVKVHVAHGGATWRARPRLATAGGDQALEIERVCRHREFPAMTLPGFAWPIGVYLDPQSIRVPEVEGLAHEMIRHADAHAELPQMSSESA